QRGGLAAAAGPEEGEELTRPDLEVEAVDGDGRTESLRHPVELDRSAVLRHLLGPSSLRQRSPDGRRGGSCHRPCRRSRGRPGVHDIATRALARPGDGDQDRPVLTSYRSNFVGGPWVDTIEGRTDAVIDPAPGAAIAEVAASDAADVDR